MSKASQHGALDAEMTLTLGDRDTARASATAMVLTHMSFNGGSIEEQLYLTPEQSLTLARWLIDVYGETP